MMELVFAGWQVFAIFHRCPRCKKYRSKTVLSICVCDFVPDVKSLLNP